MIHLSSTVKIRLLNTKNFISKPVRTFLRTENYIYYYYFLLLLKSFLLLWSIYSRIINDRMRYFSVHTLFMCASSAATKHSKNIESSTRIRVREIVYSFRENTQKTSLINNTVAIGSSLRKPNNVKILLAVICT